MVRRTRLIHFVGIGGIGMSGIAEVLVNLGYQVRGSDAKGSETTERLVSLGCDVRLGHAGANVEGVDVVVVSSAIKADNPELQEARRQKIPVIRRAEMLAELMRMKFGVAIGGTHGKTTVTSMVAAVLGHAGLDPTVVVGGKVNKLGTTAKLGQGPYLVAEADESDGSFLHLSPTIAVVTNIDPEHLDHYAGGMDQIRQTFVDFVNRIPFYGLAVLCVDHPEVQALLPRVERRVVTYGMNPQAELQARHVTFDGPRTSFELVRRGQPAGRFELQMLGAHNVQNALAVLAVAEELGVSDDAIRVGLAEFDGVERRFTVRGEVGGVMVVDDYGHHPAEIRATLRGARQAYPDRRVVVAFQPHRYTRTHALLDDFATAFNDAEVLVVAPVYAAGEAPISGVDHHAVVSAIAARGHRDVSAVASVEAVVEHLAQMVQPQDLVIAFGAGDIGRVGRALTAALRDRATGPEN
ncbi:MAG: UDP-N-acetylmuramate--L-alanine ligase [Myxococcales bacterium]|nr:UDP-N-acetylmuramate--L-alanine ligase [Myxococcales bacterium]MCB9650729.1 UDP-N-acetylmuramate--L-alanine ligase [Deltaproteobacteria bacterium]